MMTSGNDGAVHVWNLSRFLAAEQSISRLRTHVSFFSDCEFLDNNKACVTCSAGLITFDVRTGRELDRRPVTKAEIESNVLAMVISTDRKLIALSAESFPERQETYLEIFNTLTKEIILTRRFHEGDSGSAKRAFSPDNRFYVHFIKKRVTVFDVVAGCEHFDFELPAESKSVAFAPDGKSCVFTGNDGMLYRYSFPEGIEKTKRFLQAAFWQFFPSDHASVFSSNRLIKLTGANSSSSVRFVSSSNPDKTSSAPVACAVVQEAMMEATRLLPEYLSHRRICFYPWLRELAIGSNVRFPLFSTINT